jgi:type I restriction enzyme, S subunit
MTNGWHRKQLGELAELKGRIGWRGLTAKEYTKSGPLFLSVHSLNHGDYIDFGSAFHISEERYLESPEIMLQRNDILICKDGAGIGKVGIVGELPDRATVNSSLLLVRSGESILPKFLYRCLSSPYFQKIVNSRLNGATTPHLYQRDITEFPVVLPPRPEQQRIVGILDEAFDGIATAKTNAEKNLQNARAVFENHLQSVFTECSKRWGERPLASLCSLFVDSAHRTPNYQKEGIPALRPRDVVNGSLVLSGAARVSEEEYEIQSRRHKPNPGDIVYSRELSYGWAALLPEKARVCLSQGMCLFRPTTGVDTAFLLYALNGPVGREHAARAAVGTAHPHINLGDIKSYLIPFPPSDEQRRLSQQLDAVAAKTQRLESIYRQKLAALDALKQSLLHHAFNGEL